MLRTLALFFTTAALGDIIGDPTDYMSYQVWSQSEEGFYSATVSSAVYSETEQQDVVGLPEGAMLVMINVENDEESMLAIEDLDIYVGESTSEIAALVMPGYFLTIQTRIDSLILFTTPRTMWILRTRQVCFLGTGASQTIRQRNHWLRANQRPFGSWLGQRSIRQPPQFFKARVA